MKNSYPCPQYEPCPHMTSDGRCELDSPAYECDDYAYEYGYDEGGDDDDEDESMDGCAGDVSPCEGCELACSCGFDDADCVELREYLEGKGL